ncbi:T9SS type A sorting domain-containing protein [Hymenobacter sp. 5516J-16]|uniref:T9SS type A sorting domain-containing protein n=1 Tax=Hymenobacter sp. 5516J-16 TaxID=2932253 RepID=UPI001FD027B4|nr:T9SS type A sorting domain-containing protein [Hymenobacter sp. 5516J-16]UOQ78243.1 T9SS type A sorting domain-containing protein [Hymenobacter sp. 5516J-16]
MKANFKSALLIDDVIVTSPAPLPVTLIDFNATRQGQNVLLNWATSLEKNNAYFEVQRSQDSKSFSTIGRVAGNGTTSKGATYKFTDLAPLPGQAYYRLRQVDVEGTDSYSPVATVGESELTSTASVYPNPSLGTITLPEATSLVKYRVYSAAGKTVATGEAQGGSTIHIEQVPAGLYFLETTIGTQRNVQRFVRK